jgi:probable rRNA maturation factor
VLSFALHDVEPQTNLLGEIYINWTDVIKNADENKTKPLKELCILFVHGLLHLLKYDHTKIQDRKKMNALEKRIISQIEIK